MWYEIKLKMKWTYNYFIRLAFSKDSFLIGDINNNLGVLFVAVMGVALKRACPKVAMWEAIIKRLFGRVETWRNKKVRKENTKINIFLFFVWSRKNKDNDQFYEITNRQKH